MATRRQYISVVYGLLLVTGRCGFAQNNSINDMISDLMVCRPVAEVFSILGQGKVNRGLLPFFRGPAGPPGPHGNTGIIGRAGIPEDKKILGILYDQTQEIYAKLFELEMKLYRVAGHESTTDGGREKECMDKFAAPISVGSMCYSLIGGEGLYWEYKDAESNCTALGGYPADLNSLEVYEKLYDYVDHSFSTEKDAWTGMRFEEDKLLLTNGTEASYSKWLYPYPRKTTLSYGSYYKSFVGVSITLDSSSRVNGIENTRTNRRYDYAVCHFSLDGPVPTRSSPTTTPSPDYSSDFYDYL